MAPRVHTPETIGQKQLARSRAKRQQAENEKNASCNLPARSGLPAQSSVAQENAPRMEVSTPVFRPTNQPEETAMYAAPTLTVLILSQMSTAGQQRTDDGDPVSFTPAQVALNLGTEVEAERVQTRWSTLVKRGYIANLNITNLEHFGYITPRGQAFLKQVSPGTVH